MAANKPGSPGLGSPTVFRDTDADADTLTDTLTLSDTSSWLSVNSEPENVDEMAPATPKGKPMLSIDTTPKASADVRIGESSSEDDWEDQSSSSSSDSAESSEIGSREEEGEVFTKDHPAVKRFVQAYLQNTFGVSSVYDFEAPEAPKPRIPTKDDSAFRSMSEKRHNPEGSRQRILASHGRLITANNGASDTDTDDSTSYLSSRSMTPTNIDRASFDGESNIETTLAASASISSLHIDDDLNLATTSVAGTPISPQASTVTRSSPHDLNMATTSVAGTPISPQASTFTTSSPHDLNMATTSVAGTPISPQASTFTTSSPHDLNMTTASVVGTPISPQVSTFTTSSPHDLNMTTTSGAATPVSPHASTFTTSSPHDLNMVTTSAAGTRISPHVSTFTKSSPHDLSIATTSAAGTPISPQTSTVTTSSPHDSSAFTGMSTHRIPRKSVGSGSTKNISPQDEVQDPGSQSPTSTFGYGVQDSTSGSASYDVFRSQNAGVTSPKNTYKKDDEDQMKRDQAKQLSEVSLKRVSVSTSLRTANFNVTIGRELTQAD
ncbi:hypothetical protein MMC12_007699 [Toensbergia leucococca]|nr:hypothetical protein [Toensbergia leucococca]